MGDYPGFSGCVQRTHKSLYKKSRKIRVRQKGDVTIKSEVEHGERGHRPRNIETSRRWKRQENTFALKVSRRNV